MRIQSINPQINIPKHYPSYTNNKCTNNVQFQHLPRFINKIAYSTRNPIVKYAEDVFRRSLKASTRRNMPIIPELENITQKVTIGNSPKNFTYAWDIKNKNSKKYVLCLHGASQNISNVQNLYQAIIENTNFSVLALEYRGFGENGRYKTTPNTLVEDTKAAVKYLEENKKIENKNIFIIGHSMGSYPASKYVSKRDDLGRLILVSPIGADNKEALNANLWFSKRMSPFLKFLFTHSKTLRKPVINFFKIKNLVETTQTPVDIIHCQNDRLVSSAASEDLATKCKDLHSIQILKTGGHKMEKNKITAIISILNSN